MGPLRSCFLESVTCESFFVVQSCQCKNKRLHSLFFFSSSLSLFSLSPNKLFSLLYPSDPSWGHNTHNSVLFHEKRSSLHCLPLILSLPSTMSTVYTGYSCTFQIIIFNSCGFLWLHCAIFCVSVCVFFVC